MTKEWKTWVTKDLGLVLSDLELGHFEPILKKCHYAVRKQRVMAFGDLLLLRSMGLNILIKKRNGKVLRNIKIKHFSADCEFFIKHRSLIEEFNKNVLSKYKLSE